ncbi:hypothetical protein [Halomonas elongata]|uniref:hypothetical protein n=1 Tax=Halomonas elongata TaxID=2746 RepID=UPI0023B015BE|nr:hypothetical protein [Halomonas elongata]
MTFGYSMLFAKRSQGFGGMLNTVKPANMMILARNLASRAPLPVFLVPVDPGYSAGVTG